ncbi:MAG: hypothetical protein GXP32_02935 [Kiritimatiellaeota bacterium]|nr:hypothetical protein [Kiritimatiellota bacterium]
MTILEEIEAKAMQLPSSERVMISPPCFFTTENEVAIPRPKPASLVEK